MNEIIDYLLNKNNVLKHSFKQLIDCTNELNTNLIALSSECRCGTDRTLTLMSSMTELIHKCLDQTNGNKKLNFELVFDLIEEKLRKMKKFKPLFDDNNSEDNNTSNAGLIVVQKSSIKSTVKPRMNNDWLRVEREKHYRLEREKQSRPYACTWKGCAKRFNLNSQLIIHSRTHSTDRLFQCDWVGCGKQFHTKAILHRHRQNHRTAASDSSVSAGLPKSTVPKLSYKCLFPECGQQFHRRDRLEAHTAVHTGEKPLHCDWPGCEFQTVYANKLKYHRMRHTGDKPFKCSWPQCEWAFRQSHHLKVHQLRHSGEKPFGCDWPGCDRRFQSKQALRIHGQRTHAIASGNTKPEEEKTNF